jgi:hypothetical protein
MAGSPGYGNMFVPTTAVTNDQQRTFVERVGNGKVEWVDVVTGLNADGKSKCSVTSSPAMKLFAMLPMRFVRATGEDKFGPFLTWQRRVS